MTKDVKFICDVSARHSMKQRMDPLDLLFGTLECDRANSFPRNEESIARLCYVLDTSTPVAMKGITHYQEKHQLQWRDAERRYAQSGAPALYKAFIAYSLLTQEESGRLYLQALFHDQFGTCNRTAFDETYDYVREFVVVRGERLLVPALHPTTTPDNNI